MNEQMNSFTLEQDLEQDMTRIGVIGTGGMGGGHCNSLPQVENCEFVGVADLRLEAAQAIAEQHQIRAFQDYRKLLEIVDGVVVATPPVAHGEVVVAAAEAGVHAFSEKPLSLTLSDADAMIAAADKAGTHLMVGQVLRFYPVHVLGKQLIDDGEIGAVTYIETDYSGPYRGPRERPSTWYGSVGGLLENGIHKSDLINWYGGTALTVAAEVGSFSGHEDWEDYTISLIRYDTKAKVGGYCDGVDSPRPHAAQTRPSLMEQKARYVQLDMGADIAYLRKKDWRIGMENAHSRSHRASRRCRRTDPFCRLYP